jgi:hypothetical protein
LSFTSGDGAADAAMTFTGTLADLNAALDGLSFSPTASYNGPASLQIATDDQGNTGSGGTLSDTDTINITVLAVDTPPVVRSVELAPINFIENDAATNTTSTITVVELDSGLLSGATLRIAANYRAGEDLLLFNSTATISGVWNAATGTLTLSGIETVTNYENALRTVQYQNLSEAPDTATRTLTWTAIDATGNASNSVSRDIMIVSVNDLPTISVPAAQSPLSNTVVFSSANGTPIVVGDVDAGATAIEITLVASQGFVTLPSTSGITLVQGTGVDDTVLVFTGTLANVNQALDGLSFRASGGAASLQVGANDQAGGAIGFTQVSAQIPIAAMPPAPPPVTPPSPPPVDEAPEPPSESPEADGAAPPVQPAPPLVSIDNSPPADRTTSSHSTIEAVAPPSIVFARPARTSAVEAELVETISAFDDETFRRSALPIFDDAPGVQLLDERRLWEEIQQISDALESELGSGWSIGVIAGAGAVSAGYLLWLMRAGSLVASALSSLPVWNGFDPLPVLEFWERDQHDRRREEDDDDAFVGGHRRPKVAIRG